MKYLVYFTGYFRHWGEQSDEINPLWEAYGLEAMFDNKRAEMRFPCGPVARLHSQMQSLGLVLN